MNVEKVVDFTGVCGIIYWIRLPRIPRSIAEAKSMPEGGEVVFICDAEIYRGKDTMHRLMRMVEKKNRNWTICVWHNHRRKKMMLRLRRKQYDF